MAGGGWGVRCAGLAPQECGGNLGALSHLLYVLYNVYTRTCYIYTKPSSAYVPAPGDTNTPAVYVPVIYIYILNHLLHMYLLQGTLLQLLYSV